MRVKITLSALLFAGLSLLAAAANAEPARWTAGVRVGGYGFRATTPDGETRWDDCQMDGSGVFVERTLGKNLFAEAGLDLYHAKGSEVVGEGMDRVSTLMTFAAGVRWFPGALVSPYIQAGAGAEVTQVEMGEHGDSYVLPMGFLGVGAEVRATRRLKLGMSVRFHMMGHFDHHAAGAEMEPTPEAASQAQFFAKYEL